MSAGTRVAGGLYLHPSRTNEVVASGGGVMRVVHVLVLPHIEVEFGESAARKVVLRNLCHAIDKGRIVDFPEITGIRIGKEGL